MLQQEFLGDSKVRTIRLQTLWRELENIKMKDSDTIKDYHGRIKVVIIQMRSLGENIVDKRFVEKIMVSLTRIYDYNYYYRTIKRLLPCSSWNNGFFESIWKTDSSKH